jgi:hypothetical protein
MKALLVLIRPALLPLCGKHRPEFFIAVTAPIDIGREKTAGFGLKIGYLH